MSVYSNRIHEGELRINLEVVAQCEIIYINNFIANSTDIHSLVLERVEQGKSIQPEPAKRSSFKASLKPKSASIVKMRGAHLFV